MDFTHKHRWLLCGHATHVLEGSAQTNDLSRKSVKILFTNTFFNSS